MSIEKLQEKIDKAELKVQKCKGTIERHKKQLEKKIAAGSEPYEIKWKQQDIVGAGKKLAEAERIRDNWKDKLEIELEKERFIEGHAPETIKVFLENWKTNALKWHLKRYEDYQEFKIKLRNKEREARIECVKMTPEYERYLDQIEDPKLDLLNVFPRKFMDNHLKEQELDWQSIKKRKMSFAGGNVMHMDGIRDETERFNWIENVLEREKKSKMIDLITRINNEIGEITDASNLKISPKGNLDGIIEGVKGSVEINTIGAGGFNIQCFHYRTLIKKVK